MQQRFWVLTKQCSGLSLNRPTYPQNERGGFSPYTLHVIGGRGKDKDSHVAHNRSQLGFTPSRRLFMHRNRVYNIIQNLTLLFCDWGRQRRLSFYFLGNTGRVLAMTGCAFPYRLFFTLVILKSHVISKAEWLAD
jgi:hypothetical protein